MNVYHYSPENGAYIGTTEAHESPLEPGVFLVPANATDVAPPDSVSEGKLVLWTGQEWIELDPPTPEPEPEPEPEPVTWDDIRSQRNARLSACDWTQIADAPLTEDQRQDWVLYRQHLRDVPEIFDSPESVVWPQPPQ